MGNLWAFILLIGPLIFVHELGHLLVAKLVDVKVLRFSIGFGPALLKFRIGETEYCVAPIPLGGYVAMLGQHPGEEIPVADQDRALGNKPLWARYLVLAAGPIANLVLPVIVFFGFFIQNTVQAPALVGTVIEGSAAEQAGLMQGDRIVAIEDRDIRSWSDMQERISKAPGQELRIQFERDGKRIDRLVTPRKVMRDRLGVPVPTGILGILPLVYAPQIGVTDTDSPAYREGLRTGDIITSINGEPVRTVEELRPMLEGTGGSLVRLTYLRPTATQGPFNTFLWYDSAHAQLLPAKGDMGTGILPANTFIVDIEAGSPAAEAGLRPGDHILAVNGVKLGQWEVLMQILGQNPKDPFTLEVQSLGQPVREITMSLGSRALRDVYRQDRKETWFGAWPYAKVDSYDLEPIRGRFTYALGAAARATREDLLAVWTALVQMLSLERDMSDISSFLGLYKMAGITAELGPGPFMKLLAVLSVNLGLVNLLPIPVLDGGHLLFFTVEAIRRRPLNQRSREIASAIGLVVILLLLLVAVRNDLGRWFWVS